MTIFDGFFSHDSTFNIHHQGMDTPLHMAPDGLGGHTWMDQGGHILGHESQDVLGHHHFSDPHGVPLLETHSDNLGHTVINDAHGVHQGTLSHGLLGDLYLDGTHIGQMGHDVHMNPSFNVDPLVHMNLHQFPHFLY